MASETIPQEVLDLDLLDPNQPLPAALHPNLDHLVTEDDIPVDNIFSEKQQRLLTEPLYSSWQGPAGERRFVALSNVGLFYAVPLPPYVPELGLRLWTGRYEDHHDTWLRWTDREGQPIATGAERANQEHDRAERLAEQLRRLGHQPED